MVGKGLILEEILTEKQILHVLKKSIGDYVPCYVKWSEVKPAMDGIAGFLGDHMKAVLYVDVEGEEKKVHLFMKRLPANNKPKAEFIDAHNFYRREMLMFKILDEIPVDGPNPWCVKAFIYTDSIFVMPDLTLEGYTTRHFLDTLDFEHVLLTALSTARFHAAFINYETKKIQELKRHYSTFEEYEHILTDPTFCDSPWMRAAAKLSTNLLKRLSTKPYRDIPDLELKLQKLFIAACDTMSECKDTVNVLNHRDLWVNNIMFNYENDVPTNAILVDYQCSRYGPPAFDLIMLLYLTADENLRKERGGDILDYYYSTFVKNLSEDSQKRMEEVGYDKKSFLKWCEKAKMFGMLQAIAIFPFILMDPITAQKTFDDPETYDKYINEDRSEPVIAYATQCEAYKHRNLAVTEEFVETYVLKQL